MTTTPDHAADCQRTLITARYGHEILVDRWSSQQTAPIAVVQILHGLGEHVVRYERFARHCVAAGLAVVAHNHRGHGENCDIGLLGHFADEDGWDKVVADAQMVRHRALDWFPDVPYVLFGHSMGSYIAHALMTREPENVRGLILSASTLAPRLRLLAGSLLSRVETWRTGRRAKSAFLNRMGFHGFNEPFAPQRTGFDWLSRDEHEVDKYVSDPLCGTDSTNQLWRDLTGGLLEISSRRAIRAIPHELPILIMGGELDPVGGKRGLTRLERVYRSTDHEDVTLRIYRGGRHEMLNEINRDEVTADIIDWTKRHA